MAIDFSPQFHRKVAQSGRRGIWIAAPHPKTLIPVKCLYYAEWQREECRKLLAAGDDVLAPSTTRTKDA